MPKPRHTLATWTGTAGAHGFVGLPGRANGSGRLGRRWPLRVRARHPPGGLADGSGRTGAPGGPRGLGQPPAGPPGGKHAAPVVVISNSLDPLRLEPYDFAWAAHLPPAGPIAMLLDDSHGLEPDQAREGQR
ncbi:MAG: hypothetical protein WKG07_24230, partial [Hymenobacter sp.]